MMRKSASPLIISIIFAAFLAMAGDSIIFDKTNQSFEKKGLDTDINEIKRYAQSFNLPLLTALSETNSIDEFGKNTNGKAELVDEVEVRKYMPIEGNSLPAGRDDKEASLPHFKNDRLGYIKVDNLLPGTYRPFMHAMDAIAGEAGFDTLLIDLRNCREGVALEAIKIMNQLVYEDDALLGIETYFNGQTNKIKSTGKVFFPLQHINVYVGPETLNAGESLAMMFTKAANSTLIGQPTGGNHYLYRYFPLSSGSFVKLAVGQFSTDGVDDTSYIMAPILPTITMESKEIDLMLAKIRQ